MEAFIEANWNQQTKEIQKLKKFKVWDMVLEFKFGKMGQSTKAIGWITEHKDKVNFGILMAIISKENLWTINPTDMVFIRVKMEQCIKVIGLMMFSMDKAQHDGRMVAIM